MNIRVYLAIHEADVVPVARSLAKIEAFRPVEPKGRKNERWHRLANTLERQSDRLRQVSEALGAETGQGGDIQALDPAMDADEARRLLDEVEGELEHWRATRRDLTEEGERCRTLVENLQYLASAGLTSHAIGETRYLDLRFGWMPVDQYDRPTFPALRNPLVIVPLLQREERLMTCAASVKASGYVLGRVMTSLFVEPIEIPKRTAHHPQEQLRDLENRRGRNDRERERLAEKWRERLGVLSDRIREELQAVRLIDRYGRYGKGEYCHFAGDIPDQHKERIFRSIRQSATGPHAIFAGKPIKEE